MAGYTYNLNNPPEYSQAPSADSTYGTQGTNTPAAQQNQQTISSRSKTGGTDAYTMFRDAPMSWPVPAATPAPSQPQQQPSGLASVLGGGGTQTQTSGAPQMPPQSLSNILSGAGGGFSLANIPPVPEYTFAPPDQALSSGVSSPDLPSSGGAQTSSLPIKFFASQAASLIDDGSGKVPGDNKPQQDTTDPSHFDPSGKPWGPDNLPPKPPGTEDSSVWADWARKFGFLDQTLYNITAADVDAFRTSGYNPSPDVLAKTPMQNAFIAWWQNGKPTPAQTPSTPGGGAGQKAIGTGTNYDPLYYDSNGKLWGPDNLPPKPPGTEDSSVWADWARKFGFLDQTLYNITAADVDAFRTSGYNPSPDVLAKTPMQNAFIAWWQNGKPTPAQTQGSGAGGTNSWTAGQAGNQGTPQIWGGGYTLDELKRFTPDQLVQILGPAKYAEFQQLVNPQQGAGTGGAGGDGGSGSAGGGGAIPPSGSTPPSGTPGGGGTTQTGTLPIDIAGVTRGMLDPLFRQQQSELARVLRSQAAFQDSNLPSSGGFQESLGRAESSLINQQGGQLADYTNKALDRAQQLAIAQMDDATRRYGIKSNDDLQRWLNDASSDTIARLGINKNDLLERYKAELSLKGIQYSADKGVDAAALHAAAAEASAGAASAASAAETAAKLQMFGAQNKLDWAQLQSQLYMSGQQNYVTELGYLMNSGLSSADALAILGIFGGSTPVFTNP